MDKRNLCGLIGLAKRGRLLEQGAEKARSAAETHRAKLILLSCDASGGTAKRVREFCKLYQIPLAAPDITSLELGNAIGMGDTAVVAVIDGNMANAIINNTGVLQW